MKIIKYIIYVIGLIYLLVSFNYGVNIYDEGLSLVGGMRVLVGDLPYKDFWTIYAPGTYYLSAFLQIFTQQVWFEKLVAVLVLFLTAYNLNDVYSLFTNKKQHYVFVAVVILSGFGLKYLNPSGLGFLVATCSVLFALKYLKFGEKSDLIKSGLLIGLTAIFRHDYAIYLIVPIVLSVLFDIEKKEKVRSLLLVLWCVLPAVVIYLILGVFAGFGNMIDQLIVFPLTKFSNVRSLPFPLVWEAKYISDSVSNYFYNVWIAVMFLVPPVVAIVNYVFYRKHKLAPLYIYYGLLVLLFYNQALNRSDYSHLLPSLLLSMPLLFSFVNAVQVSFNRRTALVILSVLLFLVPLAKKANYTKKYYINKALVKTDLPNLNHVYIEGATDELYHYVQDMKKNILKDKPTFIGLQDMSSVEVNDVMMYYILGIMPHTKYHELHPGIADTRLYQKVILKELVDRNKYALLLRIEPERRYRGSQYFRENIRNSYDYVIKTHNIELMQNKKYLPHK